MGTMNRKKKCKKKKHYTGKLKGDSLFFFPLGLEWIEIIANSSFTGVSCSCSNVFGQLGLLNPLIHIECDDGLELGLQVGTAVEIGDCMPVYGCVPWVIV